MLLDEIYYAAALQAQTASVSQERKAPLEEQLSRSQQAGYWWSNNLQQFYTPVIGSWQTNGDDGVKEHNVTTERNEWKIQTFSYFLQSY